MIGRWLDVAAPLWIHLSPLSPAKSNLSPSQPGTNFFNADNDLQPVFRFVPVVPVKKESGGRGLDAQKPKKAGFG